MERSIEFYGKTLGLRQDQHRDAEFWVGEQCFSLWKPEWAGRDFAPNVNGPIALHVADVAAARAALEAKDVEFVGAGDTGVCNMAVCLDPDGNAVILHRRYKPYE